MVARLKKFLRLVHEVGWRYALRAALIACGFRVRRFKLFPELIPSFLWVQCSSHFPKIGRWLSPEVPLTREVDYWLWLKKNYPRRSTLKSMRTVQSLFAYRPLVSIITPVYNTPERLLREAIESVLAQTYPHWQLCLANDASPDPRINAILAEYCAKDSRIQMITLEKNGGISRASNAALSLAEGDFVAQLDHDDLLAPHALQTVVTFLQSQPDADVLYSDEDKVDERGVLEDPFFKPDWSPETFLSKMYTCHLGVYRRSLLESIGGFRPEFDGAEDYDLVLRLSEKAQKIIHIPDVLYHWRIHPGSTAIGPENQKTHYAYAAGQRAISEALERRKESGSVEHVENLAGYFRVRYEVSQSILVSILILSKENTERLSRCLQSLLEKTRFQNFEILVLSNGEKDRGTQSTVEKFAGMVPQEVRYFENPSTFHYSRLNNQLALQAKGELLIFLNDDTEVLSEDWIQALVGQARRKEIGASGAQLLYPDGTLQHAGVVLGVCGVAAHSHRNLSPARPGYFGNVWSATNVSAVTAACLCVRKSVFFEVQGFSDIYAVHYGDVDFCLKLQRAGYRIVYVPEAKLIHYESSSIGKLSTQERSILYSQERLHFESEWQSSLRSDPYYSPHLSRTSEDFCLRVYDDFTNSPK